MYYNMEKFYEISKVKIVLFNITSTNSVDGYYGNLGIVKQLFYVNSGTLTDIFKNRYIKDIYSNDKLPGFNYNPVNYISTSFFNDKELKSGLISEERLLEIYCELNSNYINYNKINSNNIISINDYIEKKRKGGK
mgnify:CR=1 FL=1